MTTPTNARNSFFSSDIPFTLFSGDLNEYSLHDLNEDNKKFLWHQFMLSVLQDIPRSLTSNEDIIEACAQLLNVNTENDGAKTSYQTGFDKFRATYRSDNAINWYTRSIFLYSAFNKACRTLNSNAIVPFHPIIKDLTIQLKQLHKQQKRDGTLTFPFTVYRGQTRLGKGELEKIRANIKNGLISMNTFLSTTTFSPVATIYITNANANADEEIPVLFQITVNDSEDEERRQIFAQIDMKSAIPDEQEVLFGMSSVFKIVSVELEDCFWVVKLELTNCKDDENVRKFTNEIKSYLYQIAGKQAPFIVFKQLFTTTSLSRVRPFTELVKYFLVDMTQLFVINAYNKEGQLKKLIDMEPNLQSLLLKTGTDNIHVNERTIYLLFDLLNNFFHSKNKNVEEEVLFDRNDVASLFCFGGFLLLTGECDKAVEYFQILLKHDLINEKLKSSIHAMLGANYVMMREKQLASESFRNALQSFESSMGEFTPPWLAASIASSLITQQDPHQIPEMFQSSMNREHSDNDVHEKLRLLHLGHICSEQNKFVEALNHWEEALEITSYMTSSLITMLNGAIYMQMAAAYMRLNNISKALEAMEIAKKYLDCYYPSTHRLFGGFNLMYGYYLIHNDRSSGAISCFEEALENPYFANDQEYLGIIYPLLIMSSIHNGKFDSAEEYGNKALSLEIPTFISTQLPQLLETIPLIKMRTHYQDSDYARQFIRTGLQLGQKLIPRIRPQSINKQNCTIDQLIALADHYRHCKDPERAYIYYIKALDRITENDSKYLWNIYKKMVRMNDNNDRYKDYFPILYSKYDDENSEHFQIISTLQIIMYQLNLSEQQFDLAFNCLIHGILMKIKFLYNQNNNHDRFDHFINQEQITKIMVMLTKLIEIYFIDWSIVLSTYFTSNDLLLIDLAKIIHHEQIDNIFNQIQSKPFSSFIHVLLKLIRQSLPLSEKSTLSLTDQFSQLIEKYKDENASLFYIMKIFQSLFNNDTKNFLLDLEQFRLNTITFQNYEKLKEKLSNVFQQMEESWLDTFLQNIATNLSTQ